MYDWNDGFSVGVDIIDAQHKELFAIGRKLYTVANSNGDPDEQNIVDLVRDMEKYTIYHFETEERLLEKYDYPKKSDHIRLHQEFKDYLTTIDLDRISENPKEVILDMLKYVSRWIYLHISSEDSKYIGVLKNED